MVTYQEQGLSSFCEHWFQILLHPKNNPSSNGILNLGRPDTGSHSVLDMS